MAVSKRTNFSGKIVWMYRFDAPGSKRENRILIRASGFATKREAADAEAKRRIEEQQKYDLAKAGATGVAAALPQTLEMLMEEFFRQHVAERLAPKTMERYREQVAYLDAELLRMPLAEVTGLHLNREWSRLLKRGGHTRRNRTPRPISAKTVRNIAGVVSSAFGRAIRWGLITKNPVLDSEPPVPKKHRGVALTPSQQAMVLEAATSPWCLRTFVEMAAATGARRGEVLALRWTDIEEGRAMISRSLTQTKQLLEFKGTKTDEPRSVSLPPSVLAALEAHRKRQDEFRQLFGADYRHDLNLIFANADGTPLKPASISASVSALFRRLKLPKGASLHSLRHTHGSHLLADGVDLATVSARLGHSSVRVTADIYMHAIRGRDDEAARRWDEFQRLHARSSEEPHKVV